MSDPTPDEIRAAMALPGWRLLPGMRLVGDNGDEWRTLGDGQDVAPDSRRMVNSGRAPDWIVSHTIDITDDATGGVLLGLLGSGLCLYRRDHDGWCELSCCDGADMVHAPTLAGACIRAALAVGEWPGGVPRATADDFR